MAEDHSANLTTEIKNRLEQQGILSTNIDATTLDADVAGEHYHIAVTPAPAPAAPPVVG